MDRFIGIIWYSFTNNWKYLKSNMDRFIAKHEHRIWHEYQNLKSNMDRFIDINGAISRFGKNI